LYGVLLVNISSLLYFDILIADFRITFAIITMGAFLYLYRRTNPLLTGLVIGVTIYMLQLAYVLVKEGSLENMGFGFIPEIFFYVVYAVIFYFGVYKTRTDDLEKVFFIAMTGDFSANFFEVVLRINFFHQDFQPSQFLILFLVAVVRSLILVLILKGAQLYRLLLLKEEHESRYQRLLHMIMLLKDEMYWLEKNKVKIEESMTEAYQLFEWLKDSDRRELAHKALRVAGDIHEIKKEYDLLTRGFREVTDESLEVNQMKFSHLLQILKHTMNYEIGDRDIVIDVNYTYSEDFYTAHHYELMSVLRNLISNSIDALSGSRQGRILVAHQKIDDLHHFTVRDNGAGIEENRLREIFKPGYSTKIDYESGEINRGLGLSLVKDIVEKRFEGTVVGTSKPGMGTCFEVTIHGSMLEVAK